jgi:hypothetical protein
MSIFREDLDALLQDEQHCSVSELERNSECGDGVQIERRSLLWLSAAAVGALLTGTSRAASRPQRQEPAPDASSMTSFLADALPRARRLIESGGDGETAYLMTLAAAMTRLQDPGSGLRATMREFQKKHARSGERFPLVAIHFKLAPGRGFEHHDHLDYNGVILGLEGEVRIRNYDFVGDVPDVDSGKTFHIRQTRDDLLLPGRILTLGRKTDNVHDVVAGKKGARVLDVFTFFERHSGSRYLDVEAKPRDEEARIYEAAWRPRRRRRG